MTTATQTAKLYRTAFVTVDVVTEDAMTLQPFPIGTCVAVEFVRKNGGVCFYRCTRDGAVAVLAEYELERMCF